MAATAAAMADASVSASAVLSIGTPAAYPRGRMARWITASLARSEKGRLVDPADLPHRPVRVPNLRHMADLAVFELHHVDVVGAHALPGRLGWPACARVG